MQVKTLSFLALKYNLGCFLLLVLCPSPTSDFKATQKYFQRLVVGQ